MLSAVAALIVVFLGSGALDKAQAQVRPFSERLIEAGMERIGKTLVYDPAYKQLSYPGGDVPADRGVCTDVVIRAYRALGIDLQKLVHEDMRRAFHSYPKRWGLSRPDKNIDHRRVPNLRRFFVRHGKVLRVSLNATDYKPGDIVTWDITRPVSETRSHDGGRQSRLRFGRKPHIGIVTDRRSPDGKRPMIVHNIGAGAKLNDILFAFKVTGHYRFEGSSS